MGLLVNMPVKDVCSSLHPILMNVLSTKLGIYAREIVLLQSSTGKPPLEKRQNVAIDDRFKLKIPITDQSITWEVVFNCSFPESSPDFDINDVDFFNTLDTDTAEELLPNLYNWNPRNEKALINVITELRSAYLKYQVDRLESVDNRCAYEYNALTTEKIPPDQVEVLIDGNIVVFFIKLVINLPQDTEASEDDLDFNICLAVKFAALGNWRATTLHIPANFFDHYDTTLDQPRNIKSDESLVNYTEEVVRSIEEQVRSVLTNREKKRRLFMFELLRHFGNLVLSYDALTYFSAEFLLERDGFVCILEVTLHQHFPGKGPKFRLVSNYLATKDGSPFIQVLNLPYNESWEISFFVDQVVNAIKNKRLETFKKCVQSHLVQASLKV